MVCQSHHLDDLADFRKYQVSQPYGNSDEETANLQYGAVLLRAADLLHITSDRAPSIAFRVINPTDPLSQQEWAKQMAVRRVRSQIGRDKDGNPDEKAPRDTIEVHAYFKDENGFFGLTSYLTYAGGQIRKSHEWVQTAIRSQGSRHQFPWRYIDDTNIETVDFIRNTFEFTLDQAKILDLLTGHTLYNDTRVVIRELAQNALDAVRAQRAQDQWGGTPSEPGKVEVSWNSKERTLCVKDNGTGMTQQIIERHLLKVGASRYQDAEFKKQFPGFSAISRFGIGVLSTFMIADAVEITTCHPDDASARQLSLRSVHGKYLIRLLDKQVDAQARQLVPHGTVVKLRVRPSATMHDVGETARRWIVVPGCDVTVQIDDAVPVRVGFDSPRGAVEDYLCRAGVALGEGGGPGGGKRVRVDEKEGTGVTVAYALEWSEYFREWSFVSPPNLPEGSGSSLALGTSVEGIRVEFGTPGFDGSPIIAISNATGSSAPRTNVARSGLEVTAQRDAMLETLYSLYCNHFRTEIEELYTRRAFSLTWATEEARYLLHPLLADGQGLTARGHPYTPLHREALLRAVQGLPVLLVESDHERKATSPSEINRQPCFWTTDCAFFRSAEMLLRESSGLASLSDLAGALKADIHLPHGQVLCGWRPWGSLDACAFYGKEVDTITVYRDQRRVDLRWAAKADPPRWCDPLEELEKGWQGIRTFVRDRFRALGQAGVLVVGQGPIETFGLSDEIGVRAHGTTYLLPGSPPARLVLEQVGDYRSSGPRGKAASVLLVTVGSLIFALGRGNVLDAPEFVGSVRDRFAEVLRPLGVQFNEADLARVQELLPTVDWRIFDPSAWARQWPQG